MFLMHSNFFRIYIQFWNYSFQKIFKAIFMELLVQSSVKFSREILNLVTKAYLKFVTFCPFFKLEKNKWIHIEFGKSLNVFEPTIGRDQIKLYNLLPRRGSYVFVKKKLEILMSEYSEWSKTSRSMIFSWRPDVLVCECVYECVYVLDFLIFKLLWQTTMTASLLYYNVVQQWSSHTPSIVIIFMQIYAQSEILWDFEFFKKCLWWLLLS